MKGRRIAQLVVLTLLVGLFVGVLGGTSSFAAGYASTASTCDLGLVTPCAQVWTDYYGPTCNATECSVRTEFSLLGHGAPALTQQAGSPGVATMGWARTVSRWECYGAGCSASFGSLSDAYCDWSGGFYNRCDDDSYDRLPWKAGHNCALFVVKTYMETFWGTTPYWPVWGAQTRAFGTTKSFVEQIAVCVQGNVSVTVVSETGTHVGPNLI